MKSSRKKVVIGWRESISLPDLGLQSFTAKIDTGARTTALHASDISRVNIAGRPCVRFLPDHDGLDGAVYCALPILHTRRITNTGGVPEERFIVKTNLGLGKRMAHIEVSLTDRSDMKYPIIIGRSALRLLRLTVDPSRSWVQSKRISECQERQQQ